MPNKVNENSVLLSQIENSYFEIKEIGNYQIGLFVAENDGEGSGNEDALFFSADQENLIFGVADGAGGHPKGEAAALTASKKALMTFKEEDIEKLAPLKMIEEINEKVRNLKVGAKATLAFGVIINDNFRCYSIGDSEIIYWNSLGDEVYSNIPHSAVGHGIEAGLIEQAESLNSPHRNIVNNLLGDEFIRVEGISKIEMKRGHIVLIGTDGLFDNLSHEELGKVITKRPFNESFTELRAKCLDRCSNEWKKDDDIAFVMIRKFN